MIPVRLELKNFLSYGTDAPPLDFGSFAVACLSGGNGEGKSALLDAMTWAIWGEARKSSGRRKPDEELIRIGTRHMEVTFTFDLEATRYRVTRSFSKSESGKTTYSDLEFQVQDTQGDSYQPLTGATQRETQARIEDTLGLNYDTFINSAFLLQGRSDEFTKKSPSQRKEILVRILNLDKYEALEDKARDRWRAAKERKKRAEAEVERLENALGNVPEREDEREAVQKEIEEQKELLSELRAEEKQLAQKRTDLEAKAREAQSIRESLEALRERIERHREERETLNQRIAEADELLEEKAAIEKAHEEHQSLQDERDALDDKRDRRRELEKALEERRSTLQDRRNELERRLDRLKVEREGLEESLEECEEMLAQRPKIEASVRTSQAARQHLAEQRQVREERERLQETMSQAREAIVGKRQQLKGEIQTLQNQIENERATLEEKEELENRIQVLENKKERREDLDEQLETIEAKGKGLSETLQEHTGQLEAWREERDREVEELRRFREADGDVCPTCGTELTESHRREVESTLQSNIKELEAAIEEGKGRVEEKKAERDELRRSYRRLQEKRSELDDVPEALATAREQYQALKDTSDSLAAHEEKVNELTHRLEHGRFAKRARRQWQASKQRLAALTVDGAAVETLRVQAAQLDQHADRLHELTEAEHRREKLEQKIAEHDEQIDELRTSLKAGTAFEELRDRIGELEGALEELDFDPDRFRQVRQRIRELSDIPDRRSALKNAQQNRAEWCEQREKVQERIEQAGDEREELADRLDALESALESEESLVEEHEATSERVQAEEKTLNELQQRVGKLEAHLEQAEADREALEEAKEEREEATAQQHRFKHLREAFGKHGIPSLIIEETLPEIEERANRILNRLTDGRMHVRLETLKEKKSGGTKETLEIIITDEHGVPRPYETYSGGESFRVNFALRVALAQLLAERSGVRVRTLVIDEGFGTQDEDGIERLVEAIQAIRTDFAKVLVITHLERLKRAFPVRIEVEKDPAVGSTFELVGA